MFSEWIPAHFWEDRKSKVENSLHPTYYIDGQKRINTKKKFSALKKKAF